MKMFMFKTLLVAGLMFLSVLFGMQQANQGIHRMKGYEDPYFKGAFTVLEKNGGEVQASILGKDVSSHDLSKKKEQLEEMKVYNFFSSMGKNLAGAMTESTKKTIQFITDLANGD